jgi:Na+/melibiose symporter-like transporter
MGVYLWQLSQGAKTIVTLAPFLMLIPTVILASILAAKMDKKPATLLFMSIYILCSIIPYAAYFLGLLPDINTPRLMWILAVLNGIGFIGFTGVLITANSMLADVADVMELKTKKRQEGLLYAAFSFAQKLTFAVGIAIASLTLGILKFPKQLEPSQVPQSTIDGLAIASIITACVFGLAGLFCFARYQLSRAAHADVQKQLHML